MAVAVGSGNRHDNRMIEAANEISSIEREAKQSFG